MLYSCLLAALLTPQPIVYRALQRPNHTIYCGVPAQCFRACRYNEQGKTILPESSETMEQVFLSLGSNLGDRLANLQRAIATLREFSAVSALSDAYETEPVGYTEQPWFVNAVVALHVDDGLLLGDTSQNNDVLRGNDDLDAPHRLLNRLLSIELSMGRHRGDADAIPKGPRVVDLDILLYGSRVIHSEALTVPHPAMHLRRFVLEPLAQIAPLAEHPTLRQSALQLLQALPQEGPLVRRLGAL